MKLTKTNLKRLEKLGVGGGITAEEQTALIKLAQKMLFMQKQNSILLAALYELDSTIDGATETRRDVRRVVEKALQEYDELESE